MFGSSTNFFPLFLFCLPFLCLSLSPTVFVCLSPCLSVCLSVWMFFLAKLFQHLWVVYTDVAVVGVLIHSVITTSFLHSQFVGFSQMKTDQLSTVAVSSITDYRMNQFYFNLGIHYLHTYHALCNSLVLIFSPYTCVHPDMHKKLPRSLNVCIPCIPFGFRKIESFWISATCIH